MAFPRHVGFTWELIYETGSRTPLKRVWFEEQSTHAALGRLPFVSPRLYGYLQPPPRAAGINGLGLMSGLVPNIP